MLVETKVNKNAFLSLKMNKTFIDENIFNVSFEVSLKK